MTLTMLRLGRAATDFGVRVLNGLVWPKVDLAVRLWMAQIFFVSGVLKLTDWNTAVDLATHEYPVRWLDPAVAAGLGLGIEIGGAVLVGLGLMTRYAALPLLGLALVIQFTYLPFDNQLFWATLFGWYAIHGAGSVSVDQLLRKGLADSALPFVPALLRVSAAVRARLTQPYLSALRLWLGAGLLLVGTGRGSALASWLPLKTFALLPLPAAAVGVLLLAGIGTRYVAGTMLLVLSTGAMLDPQVADGIYLSALLLLLVVRGGGPLSVDALVLGELRRRWPQAWQRGVVPTGSVPRIVIVGAGFGGIACARALRQAAVDVTLIDRGNHHLFQPLLYQVATAALSPGDIAAPVRPLFRDQPNVRVLMGTVTSVDRERQHVNLGAQAVPYDYLVLATGATHSYFGKEEWARFAPGLKRLDDATNIRRRILTAFERAEACGDAPEREALLTFLVVGGGPTGVELAGAIAELARHGMEREFRGFDPSTARVILVQSAARLLPTFPERLSRIARASLEALGVEVLVGGRVEQIDATGVSVGGQRIAARTVLWAAGVQASPVAEWLGLKGDGAGRIAVAEDLRVPGTANVFVVGDAAAARAGSGAPVPGLAPAAKQGGLYVARWLRARVAGDAPPGPFVYRHRGSLATIGRRAAVADFGVVQLWGAPAWWLWGLVHVGFLVGVRNRLSTLVNWFWSYVTFGGGIRLITGSEESPLPQQGGMPVGVAQQEAAPVLKIHRAG
jgi:NADH dehydrogenase/putative oxidoreductase